MITSGILQALIWFKYATSEGVKNTKKMASMFWKYIQELKLCIQDQNPADRLIINRIVLFFDLETKDVNWKQNNILGIFCAKGVSDVSHSL